MNLFHCQYDAALFLLVSYYTFMFGYHLTANALRWIDKISNRRLYGLEI